VLVPVLGVEMVRVEVRVELVMGRCTSAQLC
jgi:hypothetical protein